MELNKIEVDRLRRKAHRVGLRIVKSRQRHTHLNNRGGLMLIEIWNNTVYQGANFELCPDHGSLAHAAEGMFKTPRAITDNP